MKCQRIAGLIESIISAIIKSVDPLLICLLIGSIPDNSAIFYRYALQSACLLLFLLVSKHVHIFRTFYSIGLIGIFLSFVFATSGYFYTTAIQRGSVATVVVVKAISFIIAESLIHFINNETIPIRTQFSLTFISIIIILLFFSLFHFTQPNDTNGNAYVNNASISLFCALFSAICDGIFLASEKWIKTK